MTQKFSLNDVRVVDSPTLIALVRQSANGGRSPNAIQIGAVDPAATHFLQFCGSFAGLADIVNPTVLWKALHRRAFETATVRMTAAEYLSLEVQG